MKKILLVFGTRPEAIKMCPLAKELNRHKEFETRICLTGQHREMLLDVMRAFSIRSDYNLDIMQSAQSLSDITTSILSGMDHVFETWAPDIVLVHGDTTTSLAAALSAFYHHVPIGHVEAGLRSGNIYSPYPEEMNRILVDKISSMRFAPTEGNRKNLAREGLTDNVFVTGNTVIDAFATTVREEYSFGNGALSNLFKGTNERIILLTAHRRENLGAPLKNICNAVLHLTDSFHDIRIVYPVHPNPAVRQPVYELLKGHDRILLTEPLDVFDMHNLMAKCHLVMTDSGGLQEEAPAFGKPVIVLRKETERPEAVEAGTVMIAGTEEDTIFRAVSSLLDDNVRYNQMAHAVNPYGDGHASERIVKVLNTIMFSAS